ncbi:metallophosphoesterase [Granulicella sp. 5B5]|uniref:metallophosphoesterase n=1 Tax=Granulicella sp. 5B5 TaxID=1617967 RepID=UPI0015F47BB6|nr:metallophosphoesterase [Granulicella sp. 5B5]QMV17554.1 metallophosphoesterase [Granulicella sp. 5B5]
MSYGSGVQSAPKPGASITRRSFMVGAGAAAAELAGFASTRGRHQLQTTERTFDIANLPDAFVGYRIVQLSDIHMEEYTEAWYLERVVAVTNALKPDLVLLTGDFVSRGPLSLKTSWRAAGLCAEILTGLKAPQRYAILGNHDVAVGAEHVIMPLREHGTPFLVDSYVAIERGYDRIWLCGTDDATTTPDLRTTVPPDPRAPVLLMCHEPDYADDLMKMPQFSKVDLMLSGHSHGGQVRLPYLGPLILPPGGRKYVEGHYQLGRTQLYVNRGIGTVGIPLRFDCPSEITHITLQRA